MVLRTDSAKNLSSLVSRLSSNYYIYSMAKEIDNFDDEEMDEANGAMLDALNAEENFVPQVRDYSDRRILIWEEDDVRREACLEVLSDLLVGAYFKTVKTKKKLCSSSKKMTGTRSSWTSTPKVFLSAISSSA